MHIFNDRAIFSLPRFPRLMLACNADMNLCGKIIESYEHKRFYFEKYIYKYYQKCIDMTIRLLTLSK